LLIVLTALVIVGCGAPEDPFSAADEAAVRALEESYRQAWLANDSEAVMATLASDAVIMPAGREPIQGDSAIRAYWWPDDGSSTTIHGYEITVDEVHGSGDLAFLRGHGTLSFEYQQSDGTVSEITSNSVYLAVAQRNEDGDWRIARRAWSPLR
jgi:uncharacterized protein (TIGR02246 family)